MDFRSLNEPSILMGVMCRYLCAYHTRAPPHAHPMRALTHAHPIAIHIWACWCALCPVTTDGVLRYAAASPVHSPPFSSLLLAADAVYTKAGGMLVAVNPLRLICDPYVC